MRERKPLLFPRPFLADKWGQGIPPTNTLNCESRPLAGAYHPTMDAVVALPTLEDLRQHVLQTLCNHDHLDPRQTPLHHAVIVRSGRPCGLFFQVKGPRMLKTYAVWAGEENKILFYDSTGVRFAETRLSDAPDPLKLAA